MNYKDIYLKLIEEKFPYKLNDLTIIRKLDHLDSSLNVLELNDLLFHNGIRKSSLSESRLRSYTKKEIISILKYQRIHNFSNTEIVNKYGMSRATLYTWQKRFKSLI